MLCHSHEGDLEGEEFKEQNQVPKSDYLLKFGSFGHFRPFFSFFSRPLHLAVDWWHSLSSSLRAGVSPGCEGVFSLFDCMDLSNLGFCD